jgi:hypothetical protein
MAGASSSETKYRFGWSHPILFSPVNPSELFETGQVVFKSDNYGQTWKIISPDLTRNDKSSEGPTGGPIDLDQSGAETFPDISSFAISPLAANVLWSGSADGLVHVTTNGGEQWTVVTPPDLPQWAQITSIEPSHVDRGSAYLTASRYMWDDFHPYVYKTTDYGAHWTAMTAGLPDDQYVFVVRQDYREPRLLFAGTRTSVYVSLNGGAHWQPLALNLPGVQVRDLAIDARQGQVAIATHGRAFWILDNLALLEQLARATELTASGAQLFAPETAWLSRAYGNLPFVIPNSGQNPEYGATVFFNIPSDYSGKTPVTLTFLDASGKTVRTFALHLRDKHDKKLSSDALADLDQVSQTAYALRRLTAIEPGMNTFQWDLRYAPANEVRGLRIDTNSDFNGAMNGPTAVPGTYSVVLDYGGKTMRQPLTIALDPRLHPAPGELEARLALATRISSTLDTLNSAINAALAQRSRLSPAKQTELNGVVNSVVQLKVASSEGELLHESRLRSHLAVLMNSLDLAYQAPTPAEVSTYDDLRGEVDTALNRLRSLLQH